jgi:hypothetical protein
MTKIVKFPNKNLTNLEMKMMKMMKMIMMAWKWKKKKKTLTCSCLKCLSELKDFPFSLLR